MPKTVAAVTLGCKVNAYDTESMLELFRAAGYETTDFDNVADVYIINTCTVTAVGDRKSRKMIRRAAARNPEAVVVAAGCYAQTKAEEVSAVPGVDVVVGVRDRGRVVELVEKYQNAKGIINAVTGYNMGTQNPAPGSLPIAGLTGRTRAYLKIQDGCENYCAYCVIPYARGPVRSRELGEITDEARRIAAAGTKELVVSGISVASYGRDLGSGQGLDDVLRAVAVVPGIERVRLSSIGPGAVGDGFLRAVAELPAVCGHFHLSLQSGSNITLKRMNRRYTAKDYAGAVERLRTLRPDAAITTDVIVGFPGETETDFMDTWDLVRGLGLAALHVFPYSRREGTAASRLPQSDEIPADIKNDRTERLLALGKELKAAFIQKAVGRVKTVLFEQPAGEGCYKGLTDNYIEVRVRSGADIVNMALPVLINEGREAYARGTLLGPEALT